MPITIDVRVIKAKRSLYSEIISLVQAVRRLWLGNVNEHSPNHLALAEAATRDHQGQREPHPARSSKRTRQTPACYKVNIMATRRNVPGEKTPLEQSLAQKLGEKSIITPAVPGFVRLSILYPQAPRPSPHHMSSAERYLYTDM